MIETARITVPARVQKDLRAIEQPHRDGPKGWESVRWHLKDERLVIALENRRLQDSCCQKRSDEAQSIKAKQGYRPRRDHVAQQRPVR